MRPRKRGRRRRREGYMRGDTRRRMGKWEVTNEVGVEEDNGSDE